MESLFDGNICRCTGYRPILDAAKSLATDSNIVDQVCGMTGADVEGAYDSSADPTFPDFLAANAVPAPAALPGFLSATNLASAFDLMGKHPDAKLIGANTSVGIYSAKEHPDWLSATTLIDISKVPELLSVTSTDAGLRVGGAVALTGVIAALTAAIENGEKKECCVQSFQPLIDHVKRIASVHVRNVGTIAGNLMMAKLKGFESDMATILMGAGATITVSSAKGDETLSVADFLTAEGPLGAGKVLAAVTIPYTAAGSNTLYRSYKAALRATNAHAYVNAAFQATISDGATISNVNISYGGVGLYAKRAAGVERLLEGATVTSDLLNDALQKLSSEIVVTPHAHQMDGGSYRKKIIFPYMIQETFSHMIFFLYDMCR